MSLTPKVYFLMLLRGTMTFSCLFVFQKATRDWMETASRHMVHTENGDSRLRMLIGINVSEL